MGWHPPPFLASEEPFCSFVVRKASLTSRMGNMWFLYLLSGQDSAPPCPCQYLYLGVSVHRGQTSATQPEAHLSPASIWPDTLNERTAEWTSEIRKITGGAPFRSTIQKGSVPCLGQNCVEAEQPGILIRRCPRKYWNSHRCHQKFWFSKYAEDRKCLSAISVQLRKCIDNWFCFIQWIYLSAKLTVLQMICNLLVPFQ